MTKHSINAGMRVFMLIWFGQLISGIGSGLTNFALEVWVYQRTGSVSQFALISLSTTLPIIVIFPVAGVLVDRWNRRWALILSDFGNGLSILVIALLLAMARLEVWHIYIFTAVSSTFSTFQWLAHSAVTPVLIPKQYLGRASGVGQVGDAISQIISPVLGGLLLLLIQLQGIIMLDFTAFLLSLFTLLCVRFPNSRTTTAPEVRKSSLLHEAAYGWTYITSRKGLLGLLIFLIVINFLMAVFTVLFTPLVLSFASPAFLGTILTIGGIGTLLGGFVISAWGGPPRLIYSLLGFVVLNGLCIFAAGLRASILLLAVVAFLSFFGLSIITTCNQVIWQKKVAPDVQGKVFALRRMISGSSVALAYLVAGPLAEGIFEPLMTLNGPLANSIGQLIGVGPGRGIGLLFLILGTLTMLTTIAAYQNPRLRLVEDELPDAI